ncbi:hypothetical protein FRX31_021966, partial [Thalictrum thalictroides]
MSKQIEEARTELANIQNYLQVYPGSSEWVRKETEMQATLGDLLRIEYSILKQKAKLRWDLEGDENSSYFHKVIKERKHMNSIWGLLKEDNTVTSSGEEVNEVVENYYVKLLGTPHMERANVSELIGLDFKQVLSREEAE